MEPADFIDRNAAFLIQKGMFEYSSARAGHYSKVLFSEPGFKQSIGRARWQAFPMGLAMVGEAAGGAVASACWKRTPRSSCSRTRIVLSVFDRYPVPDGLDLSEWDDAVSLSISI